MIVGLPRLVGRSAAGATRVARFKRATRGAPPIGYSGSPTTCLDGAASGHLGYGRLSVPLVELRVVADAADATLTEVLLAIVSGGLRTHLRRLGTCPDAGLLANVPVALDRPGPPSRRSGNNTSSIRTSLAVDVDDLLVRLASIRAATRSARRQHALLGPELMRDWRDQFVPGIVAPIARLTNPVGSSRRPEPRKLADVNVTAQRGPDGPLIFGEHRLEALYLCGPKVAGVGPNVSALSYDGRLHIAVVVDAAYVTDPSELVRDLAAAHDELVDAARAAEVSRSSSPR